MPNKSLRSRRGAVASNLQPEVSPREHRQESAVFGASGHAVTAEKSPSKSAPLTYADHVTRTSREHGAPAPAAVSTPVPEAEESDTVSTPAHEANESNSKTNTALNAAIRQVIESLLNDDEFVNQLTQTIQEKLLLGMKETICQEVTDSDKFDIAEAKGRE